MGHIDTGAALCRTREWVRRTAIRHLRRSHGSALATAIGVGLTIASPLASPRQDHALLMELAEHELTRCQDELARLRRIRESDDQAVDQTIKAMAAQVAAAAEADCKKLKQAIDEAAGTGAERQARDNSASPNPPGSSSAKEATTTAAPSSAEPAAPAAQPAASTLSIHFLASSGAAAAEAKALAARFGSGFQRAETHADPAAPPKALVRYSDQADHAVAKSIARLLADRHYTWRLERHVAAQSAAPSRTVEVWLPSAERNLAQGASAAPAVGKGPSGHRTEEGRIRTRGPGERAR